MNAYYGKQALRDSHIDGPDIPFPAPLEALTDPFTTQNRTDPLDQFLTGGTNAGMDLLGG